MAESNALSVKPRVFDFTPLDYLLLGIAIAQISLAAYILISGYSLRNLLFGIDLDVGAQKVAVLGGASGQVRQKKTRSPEFKSIENSAALYNGDTILTGPASTAQIILNDGGKIDLSADTMIKLTFAADYLMGLQVSRTPKVEVVTGKVETTSAQSSIIIRSKGEETIATKGSKKEMKAAFSKQMPMKVILPQADVALLHPVAKAGGARSSTTAVAAKPVPNAKPSVLSVLKNPATAKIVPVLKPSASPSPVALKNIASDVTFKISEPVANAAINPQLENGRPLARTTLRVRVTPVIPKARVVLRSPRGTDREDTIDFDRNGDGALNVAFNQPGPWTLTLRHPNTSSSSKSKPVQVTVKPEIFGMTLDDLSIAGEAAQSNRYSGKKAGDFSAKFSWGRVEDAKDYSLQIVNAQNKVLFSKRVTEPEYEIKDVTTISSQLGERSISYRVQANLRSGFIANSQLKPIRYQFFPPVLTAPAAGAEHSLESLKADEGRILFSWQKTNFTDEYQIELSKEENFSSFFVQKRLMDNFLILKFSNPGEFFWRVRAYTEGKPGLTSKPQKLLISD